MYSAESRMETVMNKAFIIALCALLTIPAFGDDCPVPVQSKTKKNDPVPLCLVANKIKTALDDYNNDPDTRNNPALKLSTAEFDFKTVTSTSGGFKFSILVFNVGTTKQIDSTDDVTFAYAVPPSSGSKGFLELKASPDFSKELVQTIKDAAKQVAATQSVAGAKFKTLTVNLAYGVKWDFSVGATIPIQLVTIGPSLDRNKTTTQSVKLTFGQ